jgi:antitoxin component of MazEF toxin-antitoxin module
MIKAIKKVGNSQGIILDAPLMEMAHLKVGDEMHVTVHEGGSITFTPMRPVISPSTAAEIARRLIGKNKELFKRLS